MKATRDENGKFPAYAWPGGYPIVYIMEDGETLCPACANGESGSEAHESAPPLSGWRIVGADVHWEGEPETCAHCGARIESAYGVPEAHHG